MKSLYTFNVNSYLMYQKKILFSALSLGNGGTETFMINATRWLLKNTSLKVDYLIFSDENTDNTRLVESLGCRIFRLPSRMPNPLKHYDALKSFFKSHADEYSALHFCGGSLTWIAPLWYARNAGIPVRIIHAHNSKCAGLHNKILHKLNQSQLASRATHNLACSHPAGKFFFKNDSYEFIRNGVDTNLFSFNDKWRIDTRQEFNIADDEIVVGAIGRLIPIKNLPKIVSVFKEWIQRHPRSRLLIIGDGELKNWAENQAKQFSPHQMIVAGLRTDIPQCLSALDILIMPSIFEGLPFTMVEAQASMLPCVATSAMSMDAKMSEAFEFVNPNAPDSEWSDAMEQVLKVAPERHLPPKGLTDAGFDLDSSMRSLLSIYTSVQ